ncbi:beta-ketoacyl synthase N-terminal-like domain-containing protein [Amycolatopsis sp. A133]|uniref:beta-ketoacyl synthase N-terminal-like domain-containing protein n=1 Tax=Amycolatopsis sp. A133 TaxID=3064472 RepID=UPI0027F48B17|nr:beta-ketoacyl synthase N-terminal-like domain-containing protein [Amycolatopsis sp. A133]MDQ7807623.1 beta-ketoacyl synthase N-terminal-like domain-containing protein [Amycolatopsis sp. A133]
MAHGFPADRGGDLVLSTWSAVSPFGWGHEAFADGLRAGRTALTPLDDKTLPPGVATAGVIPDFSPESALGRKGTRSMDRVTAIAVKAVGLLVERCGPGFLATPERVGLTLGTGSGSVQSVIDFSVDSLTGARPYDVDPARFPNTVMNKAAAESAIWHGVRGPNTTVVGENATGLLALSNAARLLRAGRCDRVLVGSVEEYTPQRAWFSWHAGQHRPLGEGGAVFVLERRHDAADAGRTPQATLLSTRFRAFHAPADRERALAQCVTDALSDAAAHPGDIGVVAPSGDETGCSALTGVSRNPQWLHCSAWLGETSAASAGFQLAAALVTGANCAPGTLALITSVEPAGTVGCAVLRL